jgi:hypothetical protein
MTLFDYWPKYFILTLLLMLCLSACMPYSPQAAGPSAPEQPQSPPAEETSPPNIENHPPVIHNMQAPQEVIPSGSAEITCIASDANGDKLFYSWSTDAGSFKGIGDTITWIAPKIQGEYTIAATVSDGKGKESRDLITITVAPIINRPPTISIVVTPKGGPPINVISASEPITIRVWNVLEIECIATDQDGDKFSYDWSVTEGVIDGEGANVSYIAKGRGEQIITVIVTDSTGRKTIGNVRLHVQCCGSG